MENQEKSGLKLVDDAVESAGCNTFADLAALGERLRHEREARQCSRSEVASILKITERLVRVIEVGESSSLPHAVYAKGFIKAYAKLMLLDEDAVNEVLKTLDEVEDNNRVVITLPRRRSKAVAFLGSLFSSLLLIGALVFAVLWFRDPLLGFWTDMQNAVSSLLGGSQDAAAPVTPDQSSQSNPASSPTERLEYSEPASTPETAPVPEVPLSEVPLSSVTSVAIAEASSGSAFVALPTAAAESSALSVATSTVAQQEPLPVQAASVESRPHQMEPANAEHSGHTVVITGLAECWIHATTDGTTTQQVSLAKGATLTLPFKKKLVVKLGNAGGVRIVQDGKEMPPAGAVGQVQMLTFSPEAR